MNKNTVELKTVSGKSFFVDKEDYELIKNFKFYYSEYINYKKPGDVINNHSLSAFLFKTNQQMVPMFLDGNRFNFSRKNVRIISKGQKFRFRPPMNGQKYKGVSKPNKYNKIIVSLWVTEELKLSMYGDSPEHAAGLYNAMMDYCKIEGYKNEVPSVELNSKQINYMNTRIENARKNKKFNN